MEKDKLNCIPLDKSWLIRMGILDLTRGYPDIIKFLEDQKDLGSDLNALKKICYSWNKPDEAFDVGESGTIYRFIRFYSWKNNIDREIKVSDTLIKRIKRGAISNDPKIVNYAPKDLLKLDSQTSQWATMSYLLGNRIKVENAPFKLKLTYEAVDHWENARTMGVLWEARKDQTILNQAKAFLGYLKTGKVDFAHEQAEDYCFGRAFEVLTEDQAKRLYPSLEGHETSRFEEMERAIKQADQDQRVSSPDHRVVQAIAMKYFDRGIQKESFAYPNCVNKSWPLFWEFMDSCKKDIDFQGKFSTL